MGRLTRSAINNLLAGTSPPVAETVIFATPRLVHELQVHLLQRVLVVSVRNFPFLEVTPL